MLEFYIHKAKNKKLSKITLHPSGATIIRKEKYTPKVKTSPQKITDKYMARLCLSNAIFMGTHDFKYMGILHSMATVSGVKDFGKAESMYVTKDSLIYSNRHVMITKALQLMPLTTKHTAIVDPDTLALFAKYESVDLYYYDRQLIIKGKDVIALVPFKLQQHLYLKEQPRGVFFTYPKNKIKASIKKAAKNNRSICMSRNKNGIVYSPYTESDVLSLEVAYLNIGLAVLKGKNISIRLKDDEIYIPILTMKDAYGNRIDIAYKQES